MKSGIGQDNIQPSGDTISLAANDKKLRKQRGELAHFSSEIFLSVGNELHVLGHVVGSDRIDGASPFGHGSDETVAVPVLLRIASQLVSSSADRSPCRAATSAVGCASPE
jgi:hypothetical protein